MQYTEQQLEASIKQCEKMKMEKEQFGEMIEILKKQISPTDGANAFTFIRDRNLSMAGVQGVKKSIRGGMQV